MEILRVEQIHEWVAEIRAAFDSLMQNQTLAVKKGARQWQFFRGCLERTLGATPGDWLSERPQQLAQLKFEVQDKLRRFYLRCGKPVDFMFSLVHRREALRDRLIIDPHYPEIAGYCLLVHDRRGAQKSISWTRTELRAYLESVVASCVDAEFRAYQALPNIDETLLLRWVRRDGGAHRDLVHTLVQLKRLGWVLTNPFNPSTKRLIAIAVKEIRDEEAIVRTTEYWYLRWWSTVEQDYLYPLRESSRHTYVVIKTGGDWLIEENIRPQPHASAPYWRK